MKKFIAILLGLILCFSLTACVGSNDITDLKDQITQTQKDYEDLQKSYTDLEKSNSDLQKSIEDLQKTIVDLQKEVSFLLGNDPDLEGQNFKVGIFASDYQDAFISSTVDLIEEELEKCIDNLECEIYNAENDQLKQNDQIDEAISGKVNLLLVNIVYTGDTNHANRIIAKAKSRNKPIIFFTREIDDSVLQSYEKACYVGIEPYLKGVLQGELIADFLLNPNNIEDDKSKYAGSDGKTIKYALLQADIDNAEAVFRSLYSIRTAQALITEAGKDWVLVNAAPSSPGNGWTYPSSAWLDNVKDVGGNNLSEADKAIFNGYLYGTVSWNGMTAGTAFQMAFANKDNATDLDNLGIIVSNNDGMALGVINALKNYDLNKPGQYTIPVFGIDATNAAIAAISEGAMAGTIKQDAADLAEAVAKLSLNVKNKKDFLYNTSYVFDYWINKLYIPFKKVS